MISDTQYILRKATFEDALLLFNWANNSEVRQNAINPEKIKWEEHLVWLKTRLNDINCRMFILMGNQLPMGQIRLELINNYWLIDYSIDTDFRGKGLGNKIISLIINVHIQPLKAIVKKNNLSSNKIFIKCGFQSNSIQLNNEDYFEYTYE